MNTSQAPHAETPSESRRKLHIPQVLSYTRRLDASSREATPCEPSGNFHTCMACRGSALEHRCEVRDAFRDACPNSDTESQHGAEDERGAWQLPLKVGQPWTRDLG